MQNYSMSQIRSMQDDATERVREMHRRAKSKVDEHNKAVRENSPPQITPKKNKQSVPSLLPQLDLNRLLFEDSDRTLILCLILILSLDGECDEMLLLALIYIIL